MSLKLRRRSDASGCPTRLMAPHDLPYPYHSTVQMARDIVRFFAIMNKGIIQAKHVVRAQQPIQERDVRCSTQSCLQTTTKNDDTVTSLRETPHNHTDSATHVRKQRTVTSVPSTQA